MYTWWYTIMPDIPEVYYINNRYVNIIIPDVPNEVVSDINRYKKYECV